MNKIDTKLAIVIPAFKAKFLPETLESISAQTSKRFNLYICDDCSPEPIEDIVRAFEGKLSFTYRRFANNLGGTSLAKQWERSIASSSEEWIWLFSDDDIMESNCVEEFYSSLSISDGIFDVYRFNTVIINDQGEIKELNPPHPPEEDCFRFLYFFLRGLRASMMQDHIFSRRAYEGYGGFPEFPLAWCSDQALVLRLGAKKGFLTVPKAHIRFRQSGLNISSGKEKDVSLSKATAAVMFSEWLLGFIDDKESDDFVFSKNEMKRLAQEWLKGHLAALHTYLGPARMIAAAKFLRENWNEPLWLNLLRILKININNTGNEIRKYLRS